MKDKHVGDFKWKTMVRICKISKPNYISEEI